MVAKMMAKDPARRFQTPGEVSQALMPFFKKASATFKSPKPEYSQSGRPEDQPATAGAGVVPPRPAAELSPALARPAARPGTGPDRSRHGRAWSISRRPKSPGPAAPAVASNRRPPWLWPSVAAGVLLLGFIVAWAVVLRVKTPNGMIELVNLPKEAEVFVDGDEVAVTWPDSGKPAVITVTAGKHRIKVKKDGLRGPVTRCPSRRGVKERSPCGLSRSPTLAPRKTRRSHVSLGRCRAPSAAR